MLIIILLCFLCIFLFDRVNFTKVDSGKTDCERCVLEIKVNSGDPYIMYEDEFHEVCSVRSIGTKIWFTIINNNYNNNYYYIFFYMMIW